jgi:hypothetical protein
MLVVRNCRCTPGFGEICTTQSNDVQSKDSFILFCSLDTNTSGGSIHQPPVRLRDPVNQYIRPRVVPVIDKYT